MTEAYAPRTKTAAMLDRAWELVKSVPYKVTTRWLFYQILHTHYYSKKSDYGSFVKITSKARKRFYKGWRPDTLVDDQRNAVLRGDGYETVDEWLDAIQRGVICKLDRWHDKDFYLELWFEAQAMRRQFEYYTKHITLRPMGGNPSNDYKWGAAKSLEDAHEQYQAPIKVLYFGDLDDAGVRIPQAFLSDIREWCAVDFEFINCGLNAEQVKKYKIPENFEKPGDYQW